MIREQGDIITLLKLIATRDAQELHLNAGQPPLLVIDGEWVDSHFEVLNEKTARRLMLAMLDEPHQAQLEQEKVFENDFTLQGWAIYLIKASLSSDGLVSGVITLQSKMD